MTFAVVDEQGAVLASGDDLDALRAAVAPRLRAELTAATAHVERTGLRDWTIGDLPRTIELPGAVAYPALVDEGETVGRAGLRDGAGAARGDARGHAAAAGADRALAGARGPARPRPGGGADARRRAARRGAARCSTTRSSRRWTRSIASGGGPAFDAAGWAALRAHVAGSLAATAARIVAQAVEILDAARDVRLALDALPHDAALRPARLDVAAQVGGLVYPGFVAATGAERLPDVTRYLRAAVRRLERLPDAPGADRDRMAVVHALEAQLRRAARRGRRAARPRCARSAGCCRSCASRTSRRAWACAVRSPRSGYAAPWKTPELARRRSLGAPAGAKRR